MSDLFGVQFGDYHTLQDWDLYQMGPAAISFPAVRTNYISVPGRDGYLDLSTALTGEVNYEPRNLSVPFMSLASPEEWPELYSQILNAIHGRQLKIVLDEDPDWYFTGRLAVDMPSYDGTWQFTITGVLYPYKFKASPTEVSASLTEEDTEISLSCDRMPVVPTITVDAETVLTWGADSYTVDAGSHRLPGIRLTKGTHTLKARTTAGTGTITITYQEGSL